MTLIVLRRCGDDYVASIDDQLYRYNRADSAAEAIDGLVRAYAEEMDIEVRVEEVPEE